MVIPRISLSTRYILSQLEESERDDNFRLKRFKELKTKKKQKDSTDTQITQNGSNIAMIQELVDLEINGVDEDSKKQDNINQYEQDEIDNKCSFSQNFPTGEYKEFGEPDVDEHPINHVQDIMLHADDIINLSKRNDICDSKVLAINKELQVILDKLLIDRLCKYCKRETPAEHVKKSDRTHSSDNKLSNSSRIGSELSLPESIFKMNSEEKDNLGHFKRKYKESIEVLRLQNEDGTIRQKMKKVIVKTDTQNPIKAKIPKEAAKQNLYCPCFKFDSESEDSSEDLDNSGHKSRYRKNYKKNIHCNNKSGPTVCSSFQDDTKLRQCISGASTCLCPSVNLTITCASLDKLQNISINLLPFISSTYESFDTTNAKEAKSDTVFAKTVDLSYMFKNVINSMNRQNLSYVAYEKSFLESSKYAYIFSKVNKDNDKEIRKTCGDICFDILSMQSYTNFYFRNCYCYKRTEIQRLLRNACFYVINFPYMFSRCISTRRDENKPKLDAATCCYPGDISVNLTFQGKNSGILQIIKVTELPIASSVNAHLFCSPKNISQEPTDENHKCGDLDGITETKLHSDFDNSPNQLLICKETTRTFNFDPKSTQENSLNKTNRAVNEEKAKEAVTVCTSCDVCDVNYTLNNTNINTIYNDKQITSLKLPKFAYIFSKINDEKDNSEYSSKEINMLFKMFCNSPIYYSYIFSSYKRVEIENLLKNACSKVINFPYIFAKIINKRESYQNNLKLTDFKLMFVDDKNTCNCSSVSIKMSESSQLQFTNNINETDNIPEKECFGKKYFTCVDKVQKSNRLLKGESENYKSIEVCCRISSNPKCNFNHTFGNLFKNKEQNDLSYIFSKVKLCNSLNEFNSSKYVKINENEWLFNNSKDKSVIIFTNSKGDHKNIQNISNLEYVEENIDARRYVTSNFSYIFSKVSISKDFSNCLNDYGINDLLNDNCVHKHDFPYIYNNLEHKDFTENVNPFDYIRLQEIDKFFKDCCKSVIKNDFKYILEKVELKTNNQDNYKQISILDKKKSTSHDNIDNKIPKYGSVSYGTSAVPYIFNKVQQGPLSMDASNYMKIDTMFKDACESINDIPYNKNLQSSLCTEIAKLFNDSCKNDFDIQHNYEYLFEKVYDLNGKQSKTFNSNSKYTKASIQRPTLSCPSIIDYSTKSLSVLSNQSHRILVKFLGYKSGSSCFGIEFRLTSDCERDNGHSLKSRAGTSKCLISPKSCCYFDMANPKDGKMVKSKTGHVQECISRDVTLKGAEEEYAKYREKLSSFTRMLDTTKNAYAPFDTARISQETDKYLLLMDNLKSILSNSSVSSYSWKSCVMKTCQAEIENIEKNVSYSTFSFDSSLDYVSCKSDDGVSDSNWNSTVKGKNILNKDPISLNVEMALDNSVYKMCSCFSTSEEKSITAIFKTSSKKSSSYKCLSLPDVHTKEISEVQCRNVSDLLDRPNRYSSLKQECSNSSCSHSDQLNNSIRQAHQSNIESCCSICKQRNTETTAEFSNAPTPCSTCSKMSRATSR